MPECSCPQCEREHINGSPTTFLTLAIHMRLAALAIASIWSAYHVLSLILGAFALFGTVLIDRFESRSPSTAEACLCGGLITLTIVVPLCIAVVMVIQAMPWRQWYSDLLVFARR